ncbi:septal ring lytic transglycosylase RlpA family protein [[Limnothrix rosea] IAM M-220]|uniref:septal ring lytic transglycosylase RlpA family protein n=1 Tax=[Limnothrix rosea] IAM M-220 TaxID=454133 RepID=UPI00095F4C8D|nr:septal ring lytic transglycosylase RlpA family protein [[Limnothrix rosea] IAM M-220]OKH17780.1 RlpA-like protein [[Limnothrix rosea] IAM M-220]
MRLSKLTGFLSGLGVSMIVTATEFVPVPAIATMEPPSKSHNRFDRNHTADVVATLQSPAAAESNVDQTKGSLGGETVLAEAELASQRERLAENPLCQLVTETTARPEAIATAKIKAPTPSRFSNFVSSFVQRLLRLVGLERLAQAEPVATSPVAVVSKPMANPTNNAPSQTASNAETARFVSDRPQAVAAPLESDYEVWVKGNLVATVRSQEKANLLAQRLERLVETEVFNATAITPKLHQEQPAIAMGEQILFVIDETITREDIKNYEILAIRWANNLRLAFGVPALDLITAQTNMYQIEETSQALDGLASWYGPYFHGRLTANGEIYDQYAFTAAHPSMPLDTFLKVTNLDNQKSVIIRLNDRGPYIAPRNLDLSLGAARCLGSVETGVIPYKATIMERSPALAAEEI